VPPRRCCCPRHNATERLTGTTGTLLHLIVLVWTALGLSVAGLGFVAARSALRRRAARPGTAASDLDVTEAAAEDVAEDAAEDVAVPEARPGAVLVAERTGRLVRVVAGRRRFHVGDRRLLGEQPFEEITRDEAVDEGFTACTTCCG
jgi:hypothetical protein